MSPKRNFAPAEELKTEYFPVVIYARYSSQGQREESIEGQLRECKDYADRQGWTVIGEYIDRALSGKTDKRDDFQRMIRDSEKGHFRGVLMYTLDRFARNRYDSAMYKARLKKNGVRVFYAKQSIPDGPEGIILESVLEGYAEYYSENLSRNVRRGMMENALQCKVTGGLCLGYRKAKDGKLEIDPTGAKVVQEIFQLYAGGTSATQVIAYCNERGYKTARGRAFTTNSLHTILRNKKYIGVYEYEDVCIEDGVPAIISEELFNQAQARLKHNYSSRAKAKAVTDYLLTTKVFCGHCGAPMIGESGTSRHSTTYHYYKCGCRKRDASACHKKSEKKDWLEAFVVEQIVETALTPERIEDISTKAAALYERECADTRLLVSLEQSLSDTNTRLKNILDLMEQGIATASTKDRLLELEEQKQDLEIRIDQERRKKPKLTKERIAHWLMSFHGGDVNDPEYRRKVIDTLLNSVYIYDTDDNNGRRFVLTFNLSGNNTSTVTLSDVSDIVCFGVP
ncbi:MAG: recombinase family protein [Ruminococcaceae bacterium]|nr:recombinase family protein [Oscillospiraceae bacterium]